MVAYGRNFAGRWTATHPVLLSDILVEILVIVSACQTFLACAGLTEDRTTTYKAFSVGSVRTSNTILGDALAVCEVLQGAKVIELLVVNLGVPHLSLRQYTATCLKLLL